MGTYLVFRCKGLKWKRRMLGEVAAMMKSLAAHRSDEVEFLFNHSSVAATDRVDLRRARDAAVTLRQVLKAYPELIPLVYEARPERLPPPFVPTFGVGGISGLRTAEDESVWFSLKTGVDQCEIEKWGCPVQNIAQPVGMSVRTVGHGQETT